MSRSSLKVRETQLTVAPLTATIPVRGVPADFERVERRHRGATNTSCRRADAAGSSHTSGGRPLGDDGPIRRRSLCGLPALLARIPGTGPRPKSLVRVPGAAVRTSRPASASGNLGRVTGRVALVLPCPIETRRRSADPLQRMGSMHLHRRCSVDGRALLVRSSSPRFEAFRGRQPGNSSVSHTCLLSALGPVRAHGASKVDASF